MNNHTFGSELLKVISILSSHVNLYLSSGMFTSKCLTNIPTLFLILGWGYQPERVQAGVYLLFYNLLASLPLLIGILFVYSSLGSLCLFLLCADSPLVGSLFYVCMVYAILVKIPMFMVHLWLPSDHFEAPVSRSIILVGVLLKLGGYGLFRVFPVLFKFGFRFSVVWVILSLVGDLFVSLFL